MSAWGLSYLAAALVSSVLFVGFEVSRLAEVNSHSAATYDRYLSAVTQSKNGPFPLRCELTNIEEHGVEDLKCR